jgi:hypothetical protein
VCFEKRPSPRLADAGADGVGSDDGRAVNGDRATPRDGPPVAGDAVALDGRVLKLRCELSFEQGWALPDVERHPPPVARSLVGLLALTGLKDALAEFDVPAGMEDPDEEQYASWMVLWMPDARPPRVMIHQYVGGCFVEEEDLACALNESWVAAHPDRAGMHPDWREVTACYRAEHPEECASSAWDHQRKLPTPASDPLRASDASSTSAAPHGAITAR